MEVVKNTVNSRLKISDDVIITVARLATLDVKGVAGLAGEMNLFSRMKNNPPIKVSTAGNVTSIDIRIKVGGSEKSCRVAREVQKTVMEKIRTMTGIPVTQVNVTIGGAVFD
ncbi:MAG: Asp23/Gls24 family envelope stress response protein [Muribaculaceae bacterium]|nr:Asp23/Gls24 family envelope stress response protein [Alistipes senegalensis]MCM1473515.1 Asp23/Gls24 family envelope stress response protein [Muribaculaceae bacterium]